MLLQFSRERRDQARVAPGLGLEADRQGAREGHRRWHRVLWRVRLRGLWTLLHLGIASAGAVLTVVIAV
ncbi:hypothetical protein AB0N16_28440 [Streptomyces sp. NPDC051105]|uniref:hypothetical protein n=1 Tax=Streptomyces sp. NPDC051105 TaxID=3154843 RepID=UPI00341B60BB